MQSDEGRAHYSIKAAALASGLTVETVRAWERRYGIVNARRDADGHRIYTAVDVARLRRLRIATERGHAIGKIAQASDAELDRMIVDRDPDGDSGAAAHAIAARIIAAAEIYDIGACDQAIAMAFALLPLPTVVGEVLAPVLREVGDRWHRGAFTVGQERLISSAVRRQTSTVLNALNATTNGATVVFATLSGELHELGILMYAALAASRRVRVCYLGPDMPPAEIAHFSHRVGAIAVAVSLVMPEDLGSALQQLTTLRACLDPGTEIWIGGAATRYATPAQFPPGSVIMSGPTDFESRIELLNQAPHSTSGRPR